MKLFKRKKKKEKTGGNESCTQGVHMHANGSKLSKQTNICIHEIILIPNLITKDMPREKIG